ncbi:putative oxidoreductase [Fonsecaea pedrosoi]|nr:putative oxidoreductase [Fonsecaea pedrosoi]
MSNFKVWFITGTSSGFGKALTLEVLRRGDKVIASARNAAKLDELKTAGADTMSLDVTWPLDKLKTIAEEAHGLYGRIDYLINNAGYCQVGGLEELTYSFPSCAKRYLVDMPEETQAQFATNVFGPLNVTRSILPYMRAKRSGVIANFSSIGAWRGTPAVGIYEASKWAVSGVTETLHLELAEFNIKVCSIEPGYFRSNFLSSGHKILHVNHIPDYDTTAVRRTEERVERTNQNQPGDPAKGAKVIVDVLTGASGKEIPLRLALGADAYRIIRGKCEETIKGLDEWREVSSSTDIDAK